MGGLNSKSNKKNKMTKASNNEIKKEEIAPECNKIVIPIKCCISEITILPDEVWKSILSLCSISSLFSLSYVCSSFYHATKIARNFASLKNLEDKYDIGKDIARDTYCIIKEGKNKLTGEKVAIKIIDKININKRELKKLKKDFKRLIDNTYIVQYKELLSDSKKVCLVMEWVNGGKLFAQLFEKGTYSESYARSIVHQIIKGFDCWHTLGIIHSDFRHGNLLCSVSADNSVTIKISDVGLAEFSFYDIMRGYGNPDYVSPEVLKADSYHDIVDMWSIGVMTYILLSGYPPFYGDTMAETFENILGARFDFDDPLWNNISDSAKDFISHLIVLEDRYTTKQCLAHPWFQIAESELTTVINVKHGFIADNAIDY